MSKALVIDDDVIVRNVIRRILEGDNIQVTEADNGNDAFRMLTVDFKNAPPDVIIMDVVMPGMDGYTLQGKIEENPVLRKIPLIVMTGRSQMKDLFGASSNVFSVVEKPFKMQDILFTVRKALKSRNNQKE